MATSHFSYDFSFHIFFLAISLIFNLRCNYYEYQLRLLLFLNVRPSCVSALTIPIDTNA